MPDNNIIEQYNQAGTELSAAFEALQSAGAEEREAAMSRFTSANAEFQRCEENFKAGEVVQRFAAKPVDNPNLLGMDDKQARSYSLFKAINAQVTGNWKGAEFERECSDEIAKRSGKDAQGFYFPMDVQLLKRDYTGYLNAGTATEGAELVATDLMAGSFIDILRNKMIAREAGATVLSGLVGNIAIPRQSGAGSFSWVGADGSAVETAPTFDQVTMSPKTGGAFTDIGRSLLMQSSMDVENMVLNDLATISALAVDYACFNGAGTAQAKDPKGIANVSGIGAVIGGTNGAAPTWANIVDLETAVATDNADIGRLSYVTNAKVRGKLKQTEKASGTAKYIWGDDNTLNGYRALVSNQIPSNLTKASGTGLSQIFFGNFADLIIGQWGTLDVLVDPYTNGLSGAVRIVVLQDVDVCVRHAESFALMGDALC